MQVSAPTTTVSIPGACGLLLGGPSAEGSPPVAGTLGRVGGGLGGSHVCLLSASSSVRAQVAGGMRLRVPQILLIPVWGFWIQAWVPDVPGLDSR